MVDNSTSTMAEIHCWVMAPSGTNSSNYVFNWSWSQWTYAGRIIAGKATTRSGSTGEATFQLLRRERTDPWQNRPFIASGSQGIIPGAYVCITAGTIGDVQPAIDARPNPDRELDPDFILWYGWISDIEQELIAGSTDGYGTVRAYEMGHLLDRMQVTGWSRIADSGYPDPINSPPTANIAGPGQQVLGNATSSVSADGEQVYLFTSLPANCGTSAANYWTRWRLLRHMTKVCAHNIGIAPLKVVCLDQGDASITAGTEVADPTDGVTSSTAYYMNRTETPELFHLEEPTFKGQLDLLIPKSRGLGWRLDIQKTFWAIVPYTIADVVDYEIPINATADTLTLTGEPIKSVSLRETATDAYDRVTVEGGRVVWCGTVCGTGQGHSFMDGSLQNGWTAAQLTSYKAAGSSTSTQAQKTINRALRHSPGLRDVFTRYVLNPSPQGGTSINADFRIAYRPGSGGQEKPFCPELSVTGNSYSAVVSVNPGKSRVAYFPTMKILRNIPWPEGVKTDGTDNRDAASQAIPQYMQPQVFRHNSAAYGSTYVWRHLNADNGSSDSLSFPVSIDVDDAGPALRITSTPPEYFAKNDWSGANPADIVPNTDARAIDWRDLVVTIAVESDQRISYSVDRVTSAAPRRILNIRDETLHCWAVHKNTILGLVDSSNPDYVTTTNISDSSGNGFASMTRNDWPTVIKRARQVAAFAFRKRSAITIVRARPDEQPTWAKVGRMLTDVIEGVDDSGVSTGTHTVNTVVEEITRDFGHAPAMTVSTDLPSLPTFGGGSASVSASGGGAVSCTGGGTVAQQAERAQSDVNDLKRDTRRVPVIPAKGAIATATVYTLKIIDGATIFTGGGVTYFGITRKSSPLTSVASAWDPNGVGSTAGLFTAETGVGRAFLFIDGVQQANMVLVLLDSTTTIPYALINGDYAINNTTVSLPIGATTDTVTLYIPLFM